jgi:hypothetical protein
MGTPNVSVSVAETETVVAGIYVYVYAPPSEKSPLNMIWHVESTADGPYRSISTSILTSKVQPSIADFAPVRAGAVSLPGCRTIKNKHENGRK